MKKYKTLYDIVTTLRVIFTFGAIFYIVFWFLKMINIPFLEYFEIYFNPLLNALKMLFNWTIGYNENVIDMMPIAAAFFLQVCAYLMRPVSEFLEKLENQHQLSTIAERKLEEKLVNENLKQIFDNKTMQYSKFGILLILNLKVDAAPVLGNIGDLNEMIKKEYLNIVTLIRKKYLTCKAIAPGKLFMVYDNFALFDDFFFDLLTEVKKFSRENGESGMATEFLFIIDAIKEEDKISNTFSLLEKISTLSYTNKAIATPAFNIRYNLNNAKNRYTLESMGISRFFENGPATHLSNSDIELFSMKNKNQKAKN